MNTYKKVQNELEGLTAGQLSKLIKRLGLKSMGAKYYKMRMGVPTIQIARSIKDKQLKMKEVSHEIEKLK